MGVPAYSHAFLYFGEALEALCIEEHIQQRPGAEVGERKPAAAVAGAPHAAFQFVHHIDDRKIMGAAMSQDVQPVACVDDEAGDIQHVREMIVETAGGGVAALPLPLLFDRMQ